MTVAKDPQGLALVYHADYCDPHRASGMYSASLHRDLASNAERAVIGRANRYLHWTDILRYQAQGLRRFDFGGWSKGDTTEGINLNNFKSGFGGKVVNEYQCEQICTLKGWVVITTARMLKRTKLWRTRSQPAAPGKPGLGSPSQRPHAPAAQTEPMDQALA